MERKVQVGIGEPPKTICIYGSHQSSFVPLSSLPILSKSAVYGVYATPDQTTVERWLCCSVNSSRPSRFGGKTMNAPYSNFAVPYLRNSTVPLCRIPRGIKQNRDYVTLVSPLGAAVKRSRGRARTNEAPERTNRSPTRSPVQIRFGRAKGVSKNVPIRNDDWNN